MPQPPPVGRDARAPQTAAEAAIEEKLNTVAAKHEMRLNAIENLLSRAAVGRPGRSMDEIEEPFLAHHDHVQDQLDGRRQRGSMSTAILSTAIGAIAGGIATALATSWHWIKGS